MDAVVPPEISSELTQILSNLVLGDNEIRASAEKAVDTRLAQTPELYLLGLAQFAIMADTEVMRSFSLVLLRRFLFRQSSFQQQNQHQSAGPPPSHQVRLILYDHLSPRTLQQIEGLLLHSLSNEPSPAVRKKVVDCVTEIANEGMTRGRPWHQLQEISFHLVTAGQPSSTAPSPASSSTSSTSEDVNTSLRESAFFIFANSPNLVLDLSPETVIRILEGGLRDPSVVVRFAALLASQAYLSAIPPDNAAHLGQCTPLLNTALDTLPQLASALNSYSGYPSTTSSSSTGIGTGGTGAGAGGATPLATSSPSLAHGAPPPPTSKSNYVWLTDFIQALTPLTSTHPALFQAHLPTLISFFPSLILPAPDCGPTPTVARPHPGGGGSPPGGTGRQGAYHVVAGSSTATGRGKLGLGLNTNLTVTPVSSGDDNKNGDTTDEADDDEKSGLRLASLEFMVSLSEARPSMTKKTENWSAVLVRACLEGMGELDEDEESLERWKGEDPSSSSGSASSDPNDPPALYEQALDRLACALGGKAVLPGAFGQIPSMLASYDWRMRHAGLMAIASIAEGTGKVMQNELEQIINLVTPLFKDSHPRVRWAACQCVGQLCTDLEEVIQARYHSQLFNALIPAMEDPEPRVHSHAAAALINFCEGVERDTLVPYLDPLVDRLLRMLSGSSKIYVQEQAITSLAMVADASEGAFTKHYSNIMPLLLNVLKNADGSDYKKLRVKAMECAGLIAIAVGRDMFRPDSGPLAEAMIKIQKSPVDPSDTQLQQYLVGTWGKMCQALGPEFEPYLPVVMPNLLVSASAKADISVYDEDEEIREEREGWETIDMDGQLLGIRTSAIEEKCQAFETLVIYCSTLGAQFAPYLAQTLEVALPNLRFYFHEGVREACAMLIPMLLSCGKNSGTLTNQMVNATFSQLIRCMIAEQDVSFLASLYKCVNDSLLVIGGSAALTFKDGLIDATKRQLQNVADKRRARASSRNRGVIDDEEDREELALIEDVEDFALEYMQKMVGAFDDSSGLLVAISSVKELGFNQWFTEDDAD